MKQVKSLKSSSPFLVEKNFLNLIHTQSQIPSLFSISAGDGVGDRIKNDGGWKENLSRIAEAHPNTPLADRYGKKTTKEIKTRQVLKKHKVI